LILVRKRLSNVALTNPVGHNNENSAMNFYCTGRLTAIFSLNRFKKRSSKMKKSLFAAALLSLALAACGGADKAAETAASAASAASEAAASATEAAASAAEATEAAATEAAASATEAAASATEAAASAAEAAASAASEAAK